MKTLKLVYKRLCCDTFKDFSIERVVDYKRRYSLYICSLFKEDFNEILWRTSTSTYRGRKSLTEINNKVLYFILRSGSCDKQQSKYI